MSKPRKILMIGLWIVAVTGMISLLVLRTLPGGSATPASQLQALAGATTQPGGAIAMPPDDSNHLTILYDAPAFSLTDQNNDAITNAKLAGHPWIADFIFTTCATSCPLMTAHMRQLQDQLPSEVNLVSFSVDPAHDTPAVLRDYAAHFQAAQGRWFFLTGDEKTQAQVVGGMKMYFKAADTTAPIEHDTHFVLVDGQGHVRGYYDSLTNSDMAQLVSDARTLCSEPQPAQVGAEAGR